MKPTLYYCLLLILFLEIFLSVQQLSLTFDEVAHVVAGYSYWLTGDFRINPEHPPLMKLIAGFPLLFLKPVFPFGDAWVKNDEWVLGRNFFFGSGNNPDKIIFWSRLQIIIVTLILAVFVYKFAKRLYGTPAGLFALFLLVFEPNIIAHGGLVTTDIGVSAFLVVSLYFFWAWLHDFSMKNTVVCGIAAGLTLASKFSGVYVIPIFCAIFVLGVLLKKEHRKRMAILRFFGMLVIAVLVLFASYFFVGFGAFFDGLEKVVADSQRGRHAFLFGEFSTEGWWYYFLAAFAIKTPIPTLVILMGSFVLLKNKVSWKEVFLLVPILVWLIAFSFNKMNIGLRHILPVYPLLFVFASRLVNYEVVTKKKVLKIVVGILLGWLMVESLGIYPNYLSYFNQFVGGPENGFHYLIDSNIDWGQNLYGVNAWMSEHNVSKINMAYFGMDDPAFRGINYEDLGCGPKEGYVVISATFLQGFSLEQRNCVAWLWQLKPIDRIGYSLYVFYANESMI